MTGRTVCFSFLALVAACGGARADDAPAGRITLSAEPPVVTVTGLPSGRYFMDLPALEYVLDIAAHCAGDALPHSLSINVADTRVTLSREEFGQAPARHLQLTIPASQTAPLAVDDFCATEPAGAERPPAGAPEMRFVPESGVREPRLLEIPDVLSAQISLVCGDGEQRRMTWASQPLGVTLACTSPAPGPAHPPQPQPEPGSPPE